MPPLLSPPPPLLQILPLMLLVLVVMVMMPMAAQATMRCQQAQARAQAPLPLRRLFLTVPLLQRNDLSASGKAQPRAQVPKHPHPVRVLLCHHSSLPPQQLLEFLALPPAMRSLLLLEHTQLRRYQQPSPRALRPWALSAWDRRTRLLACCSSCRLRRLWMLTRLARHSWTQFSRLRHGDGCAWPLRASRPYQGPYRCPVQATRNRGMVHLPRRRAELLLRHSTLATTLTSASRASRRSQLPSWMCWCSWHAMQLQRRLEPRRLLASC